MSYDLAVFLAESAPTTRTGFLDWYDAQTEWEEDQTYDDPRITAPSLRNILEELVKLFPAMNGPLAVSVLQDDETPRADYVIGKELIYIAFSWSQADLAYSELHRLAAKYKVGFFDVSSQSGAVWLPDSDGHLNVVHAGS